MNDRKREILGYWKETKFAPVILLVIGVLASIPLWYPGIKISEDYAWLTLFLSIFVPVFITTGLMSMFLDSYSTYQYFKRHISNTLISSDYLQKLNQEQCSNLRSLLLSKKFLHGLDTNNLLQLRNSLTTSVLENSGLEKIDAEFVEKLDKTTLDVSLSKCYINNFEMIIHFYEETVNGETYIRKVVRRKIEYINVTLEDITIPIIKARRYVKIENVNFFKIKCSLDNNDKDIEIEETPIVKENSVYNVRLSSKNTIVLKPGISVYKEETSALLPLSDKDMIIRMTYPCKSLKIDFIYDGSEQKELLCWAFCPYATTATEAVSFTKNHLRLSVEGPLFKGEGIVFRYQDVL
jgi:hypothetical protein